MLAGVAAVVLEQPVELWAYTTCMARVVSLKGLWLGFVACAYDFAIISCLVCESASCCSAQQGLACGHCGCQVVMSGCAVVSGHQPVPV